MSMSMSMSMSMPMSTRSATLHHAAPHPHCTTRTTQSQGCELQNPLRPKCVLGPCNTRGSRAHTVHAGRRAATRRLLLPRAPVHRQDGRRAAAGAVCAAAGARCDAICDDARCDVMPILYYGDTYCGDTSSQVRTVQHIFDASRLPLRLHAYSVVAAAPECS
jgi:hypothetical protein